MIFISDIEDFRISDYKSLKGTPKAHSLNNIFIAESENIVLKLLKSNLELISLFAIPSFYQKHSKLIGELSFRVENLFVADKNLMKSIVGFNHHSGIMAIAKKPSITKLFNLETPIVILNGVVNSENVGSIIRNCLAFGIRSLIYDNRTSDPYLRRSVRVSIGSVFLVHYYKSNHLLRDINFLKDKEINIIAAEKTTNSVNIENIKIPKKSAIIFGSEGKGIGDDILTISDDIVHIPINKEVDSLNVASSSAIILSRLR